MNVGLLGICKKYKEEGSSQGKSKILTQRNFLITKIQYYHCLRNLKQLYDIFYIKILRPL